MKILKRVVSGWVMLVLICSLPGLSLMVDYEDDFEGTELSKKWIILNGKWRIIDGALSSTRISTKGTAVGYSKIYFNQELVAPYTLEVEVKGQYLAICFHIQEDQFRNSYWFYYNAYGANPINGNHHIFLEESQDPSQGFYSHISYFAKECDSNEFYKIRIDVQQGQHSVWINEKKIGKVKHADFSQGRIGFQACGANIPIFIDNFKVTKK